MSPWCHECVCNKFYCKTMNPLIFWQLYFDSWWKTFELHSMERSQRNRFTSHKVSSRVWRMPRPPGSGSVWHRWQSRCSMKRVHQRAPQARHTPFFCELRPLNRPQNICIQYETAPSPLTPWRRWGADSRGRSWPSNGELLWLRWHFLSETNHILLNRLFRSTKVMRSPHPKYNHSAQLTGTQWIVRP